MWRIRWNDQSARIEAETLLQFKMMNRYEYESN